mmetsp:Transcript_98407/g.317410  ORF Transcript_98407/g.317410 Transcript_98407/m.317410 type:complete len:209 (-) Transcript_98407:104-730(-)
MATMRWNFSKVALSSIPSESLASTALASHGSTRRDGPTEKTRQGRTVLFSRRSSGHGDPAQLAPLARTHHNCSSQARPTSRPSPRGPSVRRSLAPRRRAPFWRARPRRRSRAPCRFSTLLSSDLWHVHCAWRFGRCVRCSHAGPGVTSRTRMATAQSLHGTSARIGRPRSGDPLRAIHAQRVRVSRREERRGAGKVGAQQDLPGPTPI